MKSIIHTAIGYIVPLLFFYNDSYGVIWPPKVDGSLKRLTKPDSDPSDDLVIHIKPKQMDFSK